MNRSTTERNQRFFVGTDTGVRVPVPDHDPQETMTITDGIVDAKPEEVRKTYLDRPVNTLVSWTGQTQTLEPSKKLTQTETFTEKQWKVGPTLGKTHSGRLTTSS